MYYLHTVTVANKLSPTQICVEISNVAVTSVLTRRSHLRHLNSCQRVARSIVECNKLGKSDIGAPLSCIQIKVIHG